MNAELFLAVFLGVVIAHIVINHGSALWWRFRNSRYLAAQPVLGEYVAPLMHGIDQESATRMRTQWKLRRAVDEAVLDLAPEETPDQADAAAVSKVWDAIRAWRASMTPDDIQRQRQMHEFAKRFKQYEPPSGKSEILG